MLEASLAAVRSRTVLKPRVGIILGSGLGGLAGEVEKPIVIPYHDILGMPHLSAAGHAGELILGELSGCPVVLMRGRAHLYEGHPAFAATYGVRLMKALGAATLIASNAAGGLNPRFQVGELVLLDGHINLMHASGLKANENLDQSANIGLVHRTGPVYDPELLKAAQAAAHTLGFGLSRGVYLATLGPTYETRAEYRMFRRLGADMVGMSTVPETILGASLGMRVLAFSVITNVASPDCLTETTHEDVLVAAQNAQVRLVGILRQLLAADGTL